MPRISSPRESRTGLLHGREQTPLGSQTPFSWKGRRTPGHSASKPDTPPLKLAFHFQGVKEVGAKISICLILCMNNRSKLQLLQLVTPKRSPRLTPPSP